MIVSHLKPRLPRWKALLKRKQRVLALFSYRFDAHLVPDLIANIDPIVDGWIAFDDRSSTSVFSSEVHRRRILLQAARDAGADWVLAVDPDERFEAATAVEIQTLTRKSGRVAWGFNFRELYSPDAYRVDGIWGAKKRYCLFRMYDPSERTETGLHDLWYPRGAGFKELNCGLNLYHLKMIEPARRVGRRELYTFLDPEQRDQPIGYDYLADEDGARFESIAEHRKYLPPHVDDGKMWMFDVAGNSQEDLARTR